jgi:hypothetical protein
MSPCSRAIAFFLAVAIIVPIDLLHERPGRADTR